MEHHVGIDVSLELSSLCVLDAAGKAVRETKVASEPEALVAFLRGLERPITRVGLEAGPLSQWLYDGLQAAGYDVVLLETRHVKAALSAMAIKTDRRDARGIAQLLRMGWYRPVHRKSMPSQEVRALLGARKQLQIKVMDLEQTVRGLLRGFGLKVGDVSRGKLPARIRELVAGHAMLDRIVEPLLAAREAMWREFAKLHREVLSVVKEDQVCRRLMTVPGVVTVFHGVVFVLGARVVTVAGLGGRDAGVVMVMRGRVRHALRFPSSFPDLSFDRVVFRRGPSARPRRSASGIPG